MQWIRLRGSVLVGSLVCAGMWLSSGVASAASASCENDLGTCTVSNDDFGDSVFCDCQDGSGGVGISGGDGGSQWLDEELPQICEDFLEDSCFDWGGPDTDGAPTTSTGGWPGDDTAEGDEVGGWPGDTEGGVDSGWPGDTEGGAEVGGWPGDTEGGVDSGWDSAAEDTGFGDSEGAETFGDDGGTGGATGADDGAGDYGDSGESGEDDGGVGDGDDGGLSTGGGSGGPGWDDVFSCSVSAHPSRGPAVWMLGLLGLWGLRRRRSA